MGLIDIIVTSIGLAADAFATSICKGLALKKVNVKNYLLVGLYFGLFQGLMPVLGYLLGQQFNAYIIKLDHWVALGLLAGIGLNMIIDSFKYDAENENDSLKFKVMFPLALATSIDALTVGITFSFLKVDLFIAVFIISIITFILSAIGVKIGHKFGHRYEKRAQIFGGIILIIMGLEILFDHLKVM